jgi:hypothetical protein
MAICAEQTPPAFPAGNGHLSACWLLKGGNESSAALGQGITPDAATIAAATATPRLPAVPGLRSAESGAGEDMRGTGGEEVSTDKA